MRKEHRLYFAAFLVMAALVAFPLVRERVRQNKIDALVNRAPSADTKLLRDALKNCDEVRVYHMMEYDYPLLTKPKAPLFTLKDAKAQEMLRCLHVYPASKGSNWWDWNVLHSQPGIGVHGGMAGTASLEFYRAGRIVADIRVYENQMRWYTATAYKADARILPASRIYIEDTFHQYGVKLDSLPRYK